MDDAREWARFAVSTRTPRTSPDQDTTGWPPGVPYIVGNEACERFRFYGMHSILYVYMAGDLYRRHAQFAARALIIAASCFCMAGVPGSDWAEIRTQTASFTLIASMRIF